MEKLGNASGADEVQALLKSKGIELPKEGIEKVLAGEITADANGELNEGVLENVAGGIWTELCILAAVIGFARGIKCK